MRDKKGCTVQPTLPLRKSLGVEGASGTDILLAAKPVLSPDDASELLTKGWGDTATLCPLTGERDLNFVASEADGATSILKIYNAAETEAARDMQHRLMRAAAKQDVFDVPHFRPALDGRDEVALVHGGETHNLIRTSLLPGRSPVTPGDDALRLALGRTAGALTRALEHCEAPGMDRNLLWNHMLLPRLAPLLPLIENPVRRSWVADHITRFDAVIAPMASALPHQVIHNDLNPSNILVCEQADDIRLGVIDFGDAVHAPRINELAVAASYFIDPSLGFEACLAKMVEGYRQEADLLPEELDMLPSLIATRLATRILLTHWRNSHFPENSTYIMRNVANAWALVDTITDLGLVGPKDERPI